MSISAIMAYFSLPPKAAPFIRPREQIGSPILRRSG